MRICQHGQAIGQHGQAISVAGAVGALVLLVVRSTATAAGAGTLIASAFGLLL
jgi:hypothetical protein